MKIKKVDDVMVRDAIDKVANNAAEDEAQRDRAERRVRAELRPRKYQHNKSDKGDGRQDPVIVVKHAPGRAGVMPMHKAKKAR